MSGMMPGPMLRDLLSRQCDVTQCDTSRHALTKELPINTLR
jgi:hypothetical protein